MKKKFQSATYFCCCVVVSGILKSTCRLISAGNSSTLVENRFSMMLDCLVISSINWHWQSYSPSISGACLKKKKINTHYISSSCRAASADIPDPLSPFLPIIHRLRQVFRVHCRSKERKKKVNIIKLIGPLKYLYFLKNNLFHSYICEYF